MKFPIIQFEQPAGIFYLSALPAEEVMRISRVDPRWKPAGGCSANHQENE